jgi:hypothetical protein
MAVNVQQSTSPTRPIVILYSTIEATSWSILPFKQRATVGETGDLMVEITLGSGNQSISRTDLSIAAGLSLGSPPDWRRTHLVIVNRLLVERFQAHYHWPVLPCQHGQTPNRHLYLTLGQTPRGDYVTDTSLAGRNKQTGPPLNPVSLQRQHTSAVFDCPVLPCPFAQKSAICTPV